MAMAHREPTISDRALRRLVKGTTIVLAVLLVLFTVVYYVGQHRSSGPSLTERQVTTAEQAVKDAPNSLDARLTLAATYRDNKQWSDALAQYDELLRVGPNNRNTLVGKGETLIAMGDLANAKTTLTSVVKAKMTWAFEAQDPQLQKAFYDLGVISNTQRSYPQAQEYLQQALSIDQTDADAFYQLGLAQLGAGDAKSSVVSLRQAVLFVPTGWCEPFQQLAAAYTKLGQSDSSTYSSAMADNCAGKTDKAKSELSGLTKGTVKADAMLGLAEIAEKSNDSATATSWYQQVLKVRPADFTAKTGLARLTTASNGSK